MPRARRDLRRYLLCVLSSLLITSQAAAHAMLESSEPAAGEELMESPASIVLHFDSVLEPALCTITVESTLQDAGGLIATHPVEIVGREATTLRLTLPTLPKGRYRVLWQAVAREGHRTSGDYEFTIRR